MWVKFHVPRHPLVWLSQSLVDWRSCVLPTPVVCVHALHVSVVLPHVSFSVALPVYPIVGISDWFLFEAQLGLEHVHEQKSQNRCRQIVQGNFNVSCCHSTAMGHRLTHTHTLMDVFGKCISSASSIRLRECQERPDFIPVNFESSHWLCNRCISTALLDKTEMKPDFFHITGDRNICTLLTTLSHLE